MKSTPKGVDFFCPYKPVTDLTRVRNVVWDIWITQTKLNQDDRDDP
jgi:hypothetical protein